MAISDSQKVDLLFKKVGYGVSKTDTSTYKGPTGEANASPLVSPGSTIYQQDYAIPSGTILPTSNSSVVTVYRDSLTSTVQCAKLPTTSANVSWTTGLTDWIPVQYGTGYQVKLYAGPSGSSTPQNFISLPAGGSGNNDDWNFDYQAGVVNFADTNVPTSANQNGNVVYVVGARYTGVKGITTFANLQVANISINGNTITGNTGITFGGNVTAGNIISTTVYSNIIGTLATITSNVTAGNVISNLYGNLIGTSVTLSGNLTAGNLITLGNAYVGNLTVTNLEIDQGNIIAGNVTSTFYGNSFATTYANIYTDYITPNQTAVTVFNSTSAIGLPVGANTQQPANPYPGYLRYNSTFNTVEFYNGTSWISVVSEVNGQNFYGDGTNVTFTLNQTTTADGILVSINGTVQQPGYAYTVVGNQITFAQIPLVTDQIDVRFLGVSVVKDNWFDSDITITGNVLPGANVTYNLGSPTQMWESMYVSSNTIYIGGVPLSIGPGNIITVAGTPVTTYSNANVTAYLAAGTDATIAAITTAWQSNAAAQSVDISTLYSNAAIQAASINTINSNVAATNAAITAANSYNQTYTTNAVSTAINNLINSAPGTLDTLGEIAANLAAEGSAIGAIVNSITSTNSNVTAANAVISTLAPVASPALTGTPTAPTAALTTNNTQLATTGFVRSILPAGVIVMWSGSSASIPTGWYLCNGSNGTPNLMDRFVLGAGNSYAVGATGGTADAIVVSHGHTASSSTSTSISDPGHVHTFPGDDQLSSWATSVNNINYDAVSGGGSGHIYNTGSSGTGISASSSTSTTVNSTGSSGTGQNMPPYYALCYIMKS